MELAKEQIRLAFEQSEKEVQDLHQRTREGIETARLNGKQIGRQKNSVVVTRKSIESKEVIRKLSKEFGGNLSDAEIMRLTGLAGIPITSTNANYEVNEKTLNPRNRISDSWGLSAVSQYVSFTSEMMYLNTECWDWNSL